MRLFRMAAVLLALAAGCKSEAKKTPPVPASSDPEGKDLVEGAIVAAVESGAAVKQPGRIRLYKVVQVLWYPPPMPDYVAMIAYAETAGSYDEAAAMWQKGGLSIINPRVEVARNMFRVRDYRVLANEPVTAADKSAKADTKRAP